MKPIEDTPVRSALLSCRVRIIPCLLAVLAGLAASLGFVPGLHQRVADEWQMARYNAGAGGTLTHAGTGTQLLGAVGGGEAAATWKHG